MLRSFRRHLSYANVVSTLCLFVLLGGGAYAASTLPKDSVKSKQIKTGAVKKRELADNAVTSRKVANGSLLSEDFDSGQLPQGAKGDKGDRGPAGSTSCPSGTTRLGTTALCYETTTSAPQSPFAASLTCFERDLTLPTLSQAYAVSAATEHGNLLSDIVYKDADTGAAVGVSGGAGGGGVSGAIAVSSAAFRCVTYATDQ